MPMIDVLNRELALRGLDPQMLSLLTSPGMRASTRPAQPQTTAPRRKTMPSATTTSQPVATPLVRAMARQRGVALASLTGTGIGGRITVADVQAAAEPAETSAARRARLAAAQTEEREHALQHLFPGVVSSGQSKLGPLQPHVPGPLAADAWFPSVVADEALRAQVEAAQNPSAHRASRDGQPGDVVTEGWFPGASNGPLATA